MCHHNVRFDMPYSPPLVVWPVESVWNGVALSLRRVLFRPGTAPGRQGNPGRSI